MAAPLPAPAQNMDTFIHPDLTYDEYINLFYEILSTELWDEFFNDDYVPERHGPLIRQMEENPASLELHKRYLKHFFTGKPVDYIQEKMEKFVKELMSQRYRYADEIKNLYLYVLEYRQNPNLRTPLQVFWIRIMKALPS
jgi:hypothetical protein